MLVAGVAALCVLLQARLVWWAEARLPVLIVCFNPAGFASRYANTRASQALLEATPGVELFTVELAYEGQAFKVTRAGEPRHLQLRAPHPARRALWSKENLINLGVARLLPRDWVAFAWVDGEVAFQNRAWAREALAALTAAGAGGLDALQPFEHVSRFNGHVATSFASHFARGAARLEDYDGLHTMAPGYAWAMRRSLYERMGGLLDTQVVGMADITFSAAVAGRAFWAIGVLGSNFTSALTPAFRAAQEAYLALSPPVPRERVGFVPGVLLHTDHGTIAKRGWHPTANERFRLLAQHAYDPSVHVQYTREGLLVPSRAMPDAFTDAIAAFLASRAEDEVYAGAGPEPIPWEAPLAAKAGG